MQAIKNGVFAPMQELNSDELVKLLKDEQVEHVEVFNSSEENVKIAKERTGKKFNYRCGGGFKKVPSIKSQKRKR